MPDLVALFWVAQAWSNNCFGMVYTPELAKNLANEEGAGFLSLPLRSNSVAFFQRSLFFCFFFQSSYIE